MLVKILCFALSVAVAHESGHGNKITEVGPNGGKLAPIINAKESELGEKAKTVGYSEYKIVKKSLKILVLDDQKRPSATVNGGNVKWIAFPLKGKHQVIETKIQNERDLQLDLKQLPALKAVEVILPGFSGTQGPHVTYLPLN